MNLLPPKRVPPLGGTATDFNPQALVASFAPKTHSPGREVDAIYVPTKGRFRHVEELLDSFRAVETRVYLLPSSSGDVPNSGAAMRHQAINCDAECSALLRSLRTSSNPLFTTGSEWDLPSKRNFALWHARQNRFSHILLLDDDIRGLDVEKLRTGSLAVRTFDLAGPFVEDFPDTSVVGHVERAVGDSVYPFVSGSCLFLRNHSASGFFPNIYNEDWIFMSPYVASRMICSIGQIQQVPYDPFVDSLLSRRQEPGEIIADGLFALLSRGRYEARYDASVWNALLSWRREWLASLAARVQNPLHRAAVDGARFVCELIGGRDCAEYMSDLDYDRETWSRALQEVE